MKNKKALKISGIVATVIGAIATAFYAYKWYSIAIGMWIPLDENGVAVGPTSSMIITFVAAAVTLVGIALLVMGCKKNK